MSETRCTCGAGCATFGICMRKRNISIGYCGQGGRDATAEKDWQRELNSYNAALAQGIEPAGTTTRAVREAHDKSEKYGMGFNAEIPGGFPLEVLANGSA